MPEWETEGFEELKDMIDLLPRLALEAAEQPMLDAVTWLRGKIPGYPPKPAKGTASKFWTDKQRKWFWWQVREKGNKELLNYRRTGILGKRITEGVETTQSTVDGFVSMGGTPYAPWVVGPDHPGRSFAGRGTMYQAKVHKNRWWQFEDVMDENIDEASNRFVDGFWNNLTEVWSEEGT